MEFFKIRKDIPFMRHALIFNMISVVVFLLSVFFLFSRGLPDDQERLNRRRETLNCLIYVCSFGKSQFHGNIWGRVIIYLAHIYDWVTAPIA